MKNTIALLLSLALILGLTACGGSAAPSASAAPEAENAESASTAQETQAPEAAENAEFHTMADVFAYDSDNYASGGDYYIYVFEKDGIIYRATAKFPPDVSEKVAAIDIFDEQYDAKVREAVAPLEIEKLDNLTEMIPPQEELDALVGKTGQDLPLEIEKLDNLTEMIPPQEELDALVGKTGQDLLDDGWTIWSYQLDIMEFGLHHGPFAFTVVFDGELEMTDSFDEYAAIAPLTIKSVTYDGIGDGTETES